MRASVSQTIRDAPARLRGAGERIPSIRRTHIIQPEGCPLQRVHLRHGASLPLEILQGCREIAGVTVVHEEKIVDAFGVPRHIWSGEDLKPGGAPVVGISWQERRMPPQLSPKSLEKARAFGLLIQGLSSSSGADRQWTRHLPRYGFRLSGPSAVLAAPGFRPLPGLPGSPPPGT